MALSIPGPLKLACVPGAHAHSCHQPVDQMLSCRPSCAQVMLMEAAWPEEMLTHPDCEVVWVSPQ